MKHLLLLVGLGLGLAFSATAQTTTYKNAMGQVVGTAQTGSRIIDHSPKTIRVEHIQPVDYTAQNDAIATSFGNLGAALAMVAEWKAKHEGVFYEGNGIYKIGECATTGFTGIKRLNKRADKQIVALADKYNLKFEIVKVDEYKMKIGSTPARIDKYYKLTDMNNDLALNEDYNIVDVPQMSKEDAIKEFKSLKELVDLGLLTQADLDEKSIKLKAIILGK